MSIESIAVTPGTGRSVATDTIAGTDYQVVKIGLGADGSFDTLVDSGQQTSANSIPVVIASDQASYPISTVTTVTTLSTLTGGGVADNGVDSGNPIKVGTKYNASAQTYADGDRADLQSDVNGNLKVTLAAAIAGEDSTNSVMKVEHQYSYSRKTADGQVKSTAGFIHTVTFSATGTVTAGVITIYDSASESGTVVWSGTIQTGLNPTTIILDVVCGTGIYVGYDGTIANVATTVSYR